MENLFTPDCIRTYSGQYVNVFNPDPDTILIEDIAHSLSQQCRFAAQLPAFYSVAEHCLEVAYMMPTEHQLAGLLHDASEAYLLDIPSPIKKRLPDYLQIEANLMRVIAQKFGFAYPLAQCVHDADHERLIAEWDVLMLEPTMAQMSMTSTAAEDCFLRKYKDYR